MFKVIVRFGLLAALALFATAAQAHSHLNASEPAAESTVPTSPPMLKLTFSTPLVAKFSGVKLTDAAGKEVTLGESATEPADNKILLVPVPTPLAPGEYTLDWHVVAVDTHRMKGSYKFTIKP